MISSLALENFRAFRSLTIGPFKRVNLIVGKNNTGKSALLEAILLHNHPTNPKVPIDLHTVRGVENAETAVDDVCRWLFFAGASRDAAEITSQNECGARRTVQIHILDAARSRLEFRAAEKLLVDNFRAEVSASDSPRIVIQSKDFDGLEKTAIAIPVGSGFASFNPGTSTPTTTTLVGTNTPRQAEEVANFGELERTKRQAEILPALQLLEPRLKSLRLIPLAGHSVIHGDVAGIDSMIPVPMMGDGFQRTLSILLAIANAPGGSVLIDEIDNGLHYSVLGSVWNAIATGAERMNTQIFATSHSYECIRAAHGAFEERSAESGTEYELAVHRLERDDLGMIHAVSYAEKPLDTSLELDWEVR